MKALAIVIAVAVAQVAQAAPTKSPTAVIEATVRSTIVDHGFMGVRVFGSDGKELGEDAGDVFFAKAPKLGKVTVGFSAEKTTLAWFEVPVTTTDGGFRVTGILHLDRGWVMVVASLAKVVADKDLIAAGKQAGEAMPAKPLEGEDTVGRVAYWVSHGFAPPAALGWPKVVAASGTAPAEQAVGQPAVKKLVAGWDALKMVPTAGDVVDVDTYLHLVTLRVMMPIKGTKFGVPMVLTAIVDSDGTYWQWTSLQFSPVL